MSETKSKPAAVQFAAALLVVNGVIAVLDAVAAGRANGNMSGLPQAAIWLGVTIFVAGLLFDLQVVPWWLTAMLGGLAGIFQLLRAVGYMVYSSAGLTDPTVHFSPGFTALSGACLLVASLLLTLPDSKRAFGLLPPQRSDDSEKLP